MKKTLLLFIASIFFLCFPLKMIGQNDSTEYLGRVKLVQYKMTLYNDGTFRYFMRGDLKRYEYTGNYQIRNDSLLVLDSKWQCYQGGILPLKIKKKVVKRAKRTICSCDPLGRVNPCHLFIINGTDTIDCGWNDKWTIRQPFDSFFVDWVSDRSPIYENSQNVTSYKIVFENDFCFNDTHWIIKDGIIKCTDYSGTPNGLELRKEQ